MIHRKAIFDKFRQILGRGFTTAEVAQIDAAIEGAMRPDAPSEPEKPGVPTKIGPQGTALIKQFEGCRLEAYPDPGTGDEPWTIGWGATHLVGRKVRRGDVVTQAEADLLLEEHLMSYAADVAKALRDAPTSQAQFDALVSFHYNTGAINRATLTAKHKAGDFAGAAKEFGKWVNAGGRVMAGLTRRRAAERKLYESGS